MACHDPTRIHHHLALLLADQWMPEMTGVDFLTRAHDLCPGAKRALLIDLGDHTNPDDEAKRLGQEEAGKPFYIETGPLFRVVLLRLGMTRHVLLFTIHHIVCDGRSADILLRDLRETYRILASGGRPRPRADGRPRQPVVA